MRRLLLFAMLLSVPGLLGANPAKNVLSFLRNNALSNRFQQNLNRALARARFSSQFRARPLSQLILTSTPAPAKVPVFKKEIILSQEQRNNWLDLYRSTLENFESFKQKASSFLYYQSIPLEMRELSTEEKDRWLLEILPLYNKTLSLYLNTQEDPSLKYALDYLRYAIGMVDPFLVSALPLTAKPFVQPFDPQAFFLYPDEQLSNTPPDFEGKHFLIVNDDSSLLEYFEHLAQVGVLFPYATLHTQGDATQCLLWMQYTSVWPDIIFTDIQLGESNGYYIVRQLREMGYKGGIIALTSYLETEKYARQLAGAGFDGLISLDDRYYGKIPFSQRLSQAAQVYLEKTQK